MAAGLEHATASLDDLKARVDSASTKLKVYTHLITNIINYYRTDNVCNIYDI